MSGRPVYDSTEQFVAQIAKRVREESGLCALELSPVSGLGALADLKASGLSLFTGPSSAEGGGKSRGEYACGECSSRFDTARDYRAHCLTHQVLRAESRLRSSRVGGGGGGGGEREGLEGGGEEDGEGVFGGLGAGVEGALSFTCEDCDTRFSSRDTYAMHMLIRAKNESCFPGRALSLSLPLPLPIPTAPGASIVTPTPTNTNTNTITNASDAAAAAGASSMPVLNSKVNAESNTDSSHSSNLLSHSPPSATVGRPPPLSAPEPALLLAVATPPDLKHEPVAAKSEMDKGSGGRGDEGRMRQGEENPHHHFFGSLGAQLGHVTDYSAAWWSKYMPWMMTGAGLVGGASAEREGPALPLVCYLCGELFSNRDSLAMHVLFHTRDLPASVHDSSPSPSTWGKPLPPLSVPPSHGGGGGSLPPSGASSSSSAAFLGQVAARQLQQRAHYHGSPIPSTYKPHHHPHHHHQHYHQPRLSPTEAAVASAAAAAMAAVATPTPQALTAERGLCLLKPGTNTDVTSLLRHNGLGVGGGGGGGGGGERGGGGGAEPDWRKVTSPRGGAKSADWLQGAGRGVVSSGGGGPFNLTLPQRGASAPVTAPTTPTPTPTSPPLPGGGNLSEAADVAPGGQALVNARPLSADHVVLRPLARSVAVSADGHRRHAAEWSTDPDSARNEEGWHSGSDTSHHHHHHQTSAFNVYRLQRLKKLRLAKGVYRRPGARGRPPMTIYGTAGRRPAGAHASAHLHNSALGSNDAVPPSSYLSTTPTPTTTLPCSSSSSTSSSSSSFSFSSKVSSMVQALTSQGHAVSACGHCELVFGDRTLYQLHMGLHNVNNPWQCNACGCVCSGRLHFATHTLHY